jgi:hypothetical protein
MRDVFRFNIFNKLKTKTLYVERNDIFKVSSFFGQPVFRITNSGNVVANKISTTMLSIFQQSVRADNLPIHAAVGQSTEIPVVFNDISNNNIPSSVLFQGSVDFSGNSWTPRESSVRA